jgi:predicted  nucleic acid-binding Zn-ribbon protein
MGLCRKIQEEIPKIREIPRGREPGMQASRNEKNLVNNLEARFGVIEKRVKALMTENSDLKVRLGQLEEELVQAKHKALELEHFQGRILHVREKIERVLQQLDTVATKK